MPLENSLTQIFIGGIIEHVRLGTVWRVYVAAPGWRSAKIRKHTAIQRHGLASAVRSFNAHAKLASDFEQRGVRSAKPIHLEREHLPEFFSGSDR